MSLITVIVNGEAQVLNAPNKNAAVAYALRSVKVETRASTKEDLTGVDLAQVPDVLKGGKTQADLDAAAAKEAERKAKAAEKGATA